MHILYNADWVGGGLRFCYIMLYMMGGGFDFCYITLLKFSTCHFITFDLACQTIRQQFYAFSNCLCY